MEQIKSKRKIWKIIAVSLLVIGIGAGTFAVLDQTVQKELLKIEVVSNWKPYSSTDNRFTIEFPKNPEAESRQIEIPSSDQPLNYNELKAEKSQITYAVSYIDFPGKWRLVGSNTLLKKSLAILIEHEATGQQLVKQELTSHNGFPALDYLVKRGEAEVKGRLILAGTTLYRVTSTYEADAVDQLKHEQFVSSFNLLSKIS